MSNNIKFFIAFSEIFIFACIMISLDVIIAQSRSFSIPLFGIIDTFSLYGLNYLSSYLYIMLYYCIKIHKFAKEYTYEDILLWTKSNKNKSLIEKSSATHDTINLQKIPFQKHLIYYVWMRNKDCQKALNIFTLCALLLWSMTLWNALDFFIIPCCGLFLWGINKFFQGTIEVV